MEIELQEITTSMKDNIDQLFKRGEQTSKLLDKSNNLKQNMTRFKKRAVEYQRSGACDLKCAYACGIIAIFVIACILIN